MKIIIAPDSFKGSMRSPEICRIIAKEYRDVFPDAEIIEIPMADGGEGTTEALVTALHGKMVAVEVTGPMGEKVTAEYGLVDGGRLAVMEMAAASGIELVPQEKLNPMKATTFGTGELMRHAIEHGVQEIIIGIGGSATVDGGTGMAQALGYRLLDNQNRPAGFGGDALCLIGSIDCSGVIPGIKNVKIRIASDVTSPLTGPEGAAAVYGPQKGATPQMVIELDNGLSRLQSLWEKHGLLTDRVPGDGAAGGLGAGLRAFCNATSTSGAQLIAETVRLPDRLEGAALLITGEGRSDAQTLCGKLPAVVAALAKEKSVPVLLMSGALQIREEFFTLFDFAVSTSCGQTSLTALLRDSKKDLAFTAQNTARMLKTVL